MSALDRLSKINDRATFNDWYSLMTEYGRYSDIQEVVALAKANQQPTIDAMRFEAAKAAMQGSLANSAITSLNGNNAIAKISLQLADALIAELQKTKP